MKTFRGVEVYLHTYLTWELDEGELSASGPEYLTPGKDRLMPILLGDRQDPEPVWTLWRRKDFVLLPERKPHSSGFQAV
jgi:hypothetical protein